MTPADLQAIAETDAGKAGLFDAAPPMIQRSLMGSYILGMNFVLQGNASALMALNADDLNRAFRNPPRSTEQILHPEKYWDDAAGRRAARGAAFGPRPGARIRLADVGLGSAGGVADGAFDGSRTGAGHGPGRRRCRRLDQQGRGRAGAATTGGCSRSRTRPSSCSATVWDTGADAAEFAAAVRRPAFEVTRSQALGS